MSQHDPTDILQDALTADSGSFVELRYHRRKTRSVGVEKGRVDSTKVREHSGIGVRVLEEGTWGLASTDRLEAGALRRAIASAPVSYTHLRAHET